MSKMLKKKTVIVIAVELVFLILLGGLLFSMQTGLSVSNQKDAFHDKLEDMDEVLIQAEEAAETTTVSYDEIYKAKAGTAAFMYNNNVISGYTSANMQKLKDILEVDNVLVLDKSGKILAKAQDSPTDFTYKRFSQLRTVLADGKASEAFEVTTGDQTYRYYGYRINDDAMIAIEQDPEQLNELMASTSTWEAMLKNVTVGLDGFSFAISTKDYTFLYYPDEDIVGTDAFNAGIKVTDLEDGNYAWMEIDGKEYYCGVSDQDEAYILCAVPKSEINSARNTTVMIILFTFFAVLTLMTTYALFIKQKETGDEDTVKIGKFRYDKNVGKKLMMISAIGLVVILAVSFYMQTLFAFSQQSLSNNQHVSEIEREIKGYENEKEDITEMYNQRYLNKAEIAANILTAEPALRSRAKLEQLSNILGVEYISIFDASGKQTVTDSPYTGISLSTDAEDPSYEFRKLLQGREYLIQEAGRDELSGDYVQFIGVSLRDEAGEANGFVRICVKPTQLEDVLDNMQIDKVLGNMKIGNDGVVFAIDKEKGDFVYYPDSKYIGKAASSYGITKSQLVDGFDGYIDIGSSKYYASSAEVGGYYVYAAIPTESIGTGRLPITIASFGAGLAVIIILFLLLSFSRDRDDNYYEALSSTKPDGPDGNNPGGGDDGSDAESIVKKKKEPGKIRKRVAASNRWDYTFTAWTEKTAEQQFFTVFKALVGILAVVISIAVLFKDSLFDSHSIFRYVLSGEWNHGLNIFAVTCSLLLICVVGVVTMILQKILAILAKNLNAKGETICRLLHNFVKYISMIALLYYCLSLFGIDTKTLLASAGILTLIVGLGAQTLVSDILAGLFIIFEGEFQVGDIVTIGDWRGTVKEIGIRTTKIQDAGQNVKVISNSDVVGVINMTRDHSYAWVDVGIEYGESLERVESILEDEFPNIKKRIPEIIEGPFYKGVVALGESSVNIRVMVLCAESDRVQMERDLNREMKLIFDKHDINMPFPQVVINKPIEFQKATEEQKLKAERFNQEQKDLTDDLIEEVQDDDDR